MNENNNCIENFLDDIKEVDFENKDNLFIFNSNFEEFTCNNITINNDITSEDNLRELLEKNKDKISDILKSRFFITMFEGEKCPYCVFQKQTIEEINKCLNLNIIKYQFNLSQAEWKENSNLLDIRINKLSIFSLPTLFIINKQNRTLVFRNNSPNKIGFLNFSELAKILISLTK